MNSTVIIESEGKKIKIEIEGIVKNVITENVYSFSKEETLHQIEIPNKNSLINKNDNKFIPFIGGKVNPNFMKGERITTINKPEGIGTVTKFAVLQTGQLYFSVILDDKSKTVDGRTKYNISDIKPNIIFLNDESNKHFHNLKIKAKLMDNMLV